MTSKPYKAAVAFVLAFAGSLLASLQDRTDLDTMTGGQWMLVLLAAVVSAGAVYAVPNPPTVKRTEAGRADVLYILLVALVVVILLVILLPRL